MMQKLIDTAKTVLQQQTHLPFAVYSSVKEQHILNVPVLKPLLILVLEGCKTLASEKEIRCPSGSFIFLSNSPRVDMRNTPVDREYFALLIEFDCEDFDCLTREQMPPVKHIHGESSPLLVSAVQQFVEWSAFAPSELWPLRRQEILRTLHHLGFQGLSTLAEKPGISHKVHEIISSDFQQDLDAETLSSILSMSESTLRRRLNAENTNLQELKDKARLSHGLHLVQTSLEPIGLIAEQCGYLSQSRFTDKFKRLFGITPTELRKGRAQNNSQVLAPR